jgi:hypothetical protein
MTSSSLTIRDIERHKAAIARNDLSKPVRLALEANLFNPSTTFFDYGCGLGGDVKRVASRGYISNGWDPYYRLNTIPATADIGYIINVIESQAERREALIKAWAITRQVLIVAAQVLVAQGNSQIALLFSLGDLSRISTCCRPSKIGKRLPDSLYIHVSALKNLDPLLRLYEGCASRTIVVWRMQR